jgi:hypothetical protein
MEKIFNRGYEVVFNGAKQAVKALDWSIKYKNSEKGLIEASSSGSFLSWGETIEIKISKVNESSTKVVVKSASTAQLFSWGTNSSNEEDFIKELKNILKK